MTQHLQEITHAQWLHDNTPVNVRIGAAQIKLPVGLLTLDMTAEGALHYLRFYYTHDDRADRYFKFVHPDTSPQRFSVLLAYPDGQPFYTWVDAADGEEAVAVARAEIRKALAWARGDDDEAEFDVLGVWRGWLRMEPTT